MANIKIGGVWAGELNRRKRKRKPGPDYSDMDIKRELGQFTNWTVSRAQIDAVWTKFKDILLEKFLAREVVVLYGLGHFDYMHVKGRWQSARSGPIKSKRHWQPGFYYLVFRPGTALSKLMMERQRKELPQAPPLENAEPPVAADKVTPASVA